MPFLKKHHTAIGRLLKYFSFVVCGIWANRDLSIGVHTTTALQGDNLYLLYTSRQWYY